MAYFDTLPRWQRDAINELGIDAAKLIQMLEADFRHVDPKLIEMDFNATRPELEAIQRQPVAV